MQALVERTAKAGRLREDITGADLTLIVTQLSALEATDATGRRHFETAT